jgi:hypothetical protein
LAAGKWKLYEQAKKHLSDGTFDLDSNTFKITLHSSASNANTLTTSSAFSDLTNELSTANGYTAGGIALTSVTWTNSSGTMTFTCAAVVWTASGGSITARFAVIRGSGTLNGIVDPILAVCLMDTTPADVTATNGNTLTITPNASGLFTLSGATVD